MLPAIVLLAVTAACAADETLSRREWKVGELTREALVYVPPAAKTTSSPLVFVFHGHNGKMEGMARKSLVQELWPEALVVYPQGLNTTSSRDPEGKQAGWQRLPGQDKDRDLQFFDAMLESLKRDYQVDPRRIYSTGHSNGGAFTYLLWGTRGDVLAAIAAVGSVVLVPAEEITAKLSPKPVLHVAGENDEIVPFEKQRNTMDLIRMLNQCGAGEPWGPQYCTIYASKLGTPLVTYIHPAGHGFPDDAKKAVVKFLQGHAKR